MKDVIEQIRKMIRRDMENVPIRDIVPYEVLLDEAVKRHESEIANASNYDDVVEKLNHRIRTAKIENGWKNDIESIGRIKGLEEALEILKEFEI